MIAVTEFLHEQPTQVHRESRPHARVHIGTKGGILRLVVSAQQEPIGVETIGIGKDLGIAMALVDQDAQQPAGRYPEAVNGQGLDHAAIQKLALLKPQCFQHHTRGQVRWLCALGLSQHTWRLAHRVLPRGMLGQLGEHPVQQSGNIAVGQSKDEKQIAGSRGVVERRRVGREHAA